MRESRGSPVVRRPLPGLLEALVCRAADRHIVRSDELVAQQAGNENVDGAGVDIGAVVPATCGSEVITSASG